MQCQSILTVVLLTIVVFVGATTTITTIAPHLTTTIKSVSSTLTTTTNKTNVDNENEGKEEEAEHKTKSTEEMTTTTTKGNILQHHEVVTKLQNASRVTLEQVEARRQMSTTEIMANSQELFEKYVANSEVGGSHDHHKSQQTNEITTKTTTKTEMIPEVNYYHIKLAELVNDRDRDREQVNNATPKITTTKTTTTRAKVQKDNKKNIIDLYPLEKSEAKQRQNLMTNDVEEQQQKKQQHHIKEEEKGVQQHQRRSVNYFTGKLLSEEDGGVITEIEQKFRLSELATKAPEHVSLERLDAAIAKVFAAAAAKEGATNTHTNVQQIYLERRVKKSFNYAKQQSNATTTTRTTTTATTTMSAEPIVRKNKETIQHPEYSTTKFYNNELTTNKNNTHKPNNKNKNIIINKQYAVLTNPKSKIFRKSKDMNLPSLGKLAPTTMKTKTTTNAAGGEVLSAEIVAPTHSEHKEALERVKWRLKAILPVTNKNNNNNNTTKTNYNNTVYTHKPNNVMQSTPAITTAYNQVGITETTTTTRTRIKPKTNIRTVEVTTNANVGSLVTGTSATTANGYKTGKSKTSVHVNVPKATTTTVATSTIINQNVEVDTALPIVTTTAKQISLKATKILNNNNNNNYYQQRATNPTKSSSKPISRPRTLSQLQLKINALDCEIANVPPDAHLWRGNETHELLLPVMVSFLTIVFVLIDFTNFI